MSSTKSPQREVFATRGAFIFAAIGSAVGLGNIWRFRTSRTTTAAAPSSSPISSLF
ncbi:hypothetical protein [Brevibacterium aurantiacum]|uniref:hypothetical protein n=1 Tax=Brevibacterium aurantiacum TaxID=273384 RepID=UPI001F0A218B|nr:hypothetical protein [Brevibacterium aurantiacum]